MCKIKLLGAALLLFCAPLAAAEAPGAAQLYTQHCAACHGPDRLGGTGPALFPENLERLRKAEAEKVLKEGRPATQMAGFADKLDEAQRKALLEYIYTAPARMPALGMEEIRASRIVHNAPESLPDKPVYDADPLNLFLVVETGDHHATVLDGDKLEPIHRFQTRFALHGGPKYSPDGRFVYLASRDGWVSMFDMYNLKLVAEVRAGINTRNIAVSDDGKYVLAGNYLPHTLVVLDARDLTPLQLIEAGEGQGSRVSAVYTAPPRHSFIVALKDLPEVWEISYAGQEQTLPVRRIKLDGVLDDFFFDQSYRHLMGAARSGGGQVVDLDAGRKIADLDLPGMPHLGSGITWQYQDKPVLATPNIKEGVVSVIDMQTWRTVKKIDTLGPGFFMRSHPDTPYAWVDAFLSQNKDTVQIIDKRTLEIVENLRPAPGKTTAHVEFDRYGKYALVSIWEMDGAVVVYDAKTLKEIKHLPMVKPSGKYNVYNKINYAEGTSH